jgi:hypothetical protein
MFLTLEDMKKLIDSRVDELVDLLGTTQDIALILFHHFHWSKDKLENSEWFSHPEKLRKEAGIDPKIENTEIENKECPLCFSSFEDSS